MKIKQNPLKGIKEAIGGSPLFFTMATLVLLHGSGLKAENLPADVPKDSADQVEEYRKSAEQGDLEAIHQLGRCYSFGNGVAKDDTEAVKWYRMGAERGYAKSQNNIGTAYLTGVGVPKDEAEGVKWYRKAADQGFPNAQFLLGNSYSLGQGVPKDEAEGVKWYRKAADQGFADAQYLLGRSYSIGQGVSKNEAEGVKWHRKAADQGLAVAQYVLGNCYLNGEGMPKDEAEGVKWYRKAADQGYALAQFTIAGSYFKGEGVTKDPVMSYAWFTIAAESGDVEAEKIIKIVTLSLNSEQIAEAQRIIRELKTEMVSNVREAKSENATSDTHSESTYLDGAKFNEYLKGAEAGDALQQVKLAQCYRFGLGTAKDPIRALMWASIAAETGEPGANENQMAVSLSMTSDQILTAIQLVAEWNQKKNPNSPRIAVGEKFETLLDYTNVEIVKIEANGIRIRHRDGAGKIRFEKLPEDFRKQLGSNGQLGDIHAKKVAHELNEAKEIRKLDAAIQSERIEASGTVLQVVENGVLLKDVSGYSPKRVPREEKYNESYGGPSGLHPDRAYSYVERTRTVWEKKLVLHSNLVFVSCDTEGLRDNMEFSSAIYPIGTYTYKNINGTNKTVRKYSTNSMDLAVEMLGIDFTED